MIGRDIFIKKPACIYPKKIFYRPGNQKSIIILFIEERKLTFFKCIDDDSPVFI